MIQWFVVHEPTGQIVGAVLSEIKPDPIREGWTVHTEEELLATERGQRMLEQYEFWEKRP